MSKSIRIRTTPGGEDKYVKLNLEQDFDFLEILSLKLTQEDVYRRFYSDYGVVVGRVIMNNGVGVPNAKVSVFVPLDEDENDELKTIYPYESIVDENDEGIRYNLLPTKLQDDCQVPVGSFPTKREILDNELNLEVFEKYYKYTSRTNGAGDFMIFGVPVGNHMINVDVDISDIGIFSQKPYDLIEEGSPEKLFYSTTQFNKSRNLNLLPQIKNQKTSINVLPFWGDKQSNEVGISRIDFDINYELKPKAIFIGSAFTDNDKNSINKNCQTRIKAGKVCETIPNGGRVTMIRKRLDGEIEPFHLNGEIDDNGVWVYQIPMNLDYMVTDEFGRLIPSEDPNKGIPTRADVRFKIESEITGGEGRLRTRANHLVPHNPKNKEEIDYEFSENTKDSSFRTLYWNKIYTVKSHIPRFQSNNRGQSRKFTGFKDVDDCIGSKNPIPFNRLDVDFNPLYIIICLIIRAVLGVFRVVNKVLAFRFPVIGGRILCGLGCANIECNGLVYAPDCKCGTGKGDNQNFGDALDCFQIKLAEALNVYELDFYNDWVNGTVYSLLLKYKKKGTKEKFCDVNDDSRNYLIDSFSGDRFDFTSPVHVNEGVIKSYKDELYYAPTTKDVRFRLFATDIVSLGVINDYDWQGQPSIHQFLVPTSYKVPPFTGDDEDYDYTPFVDYGGEDGLIFDLDCLKPTVNSTQAKNIKRICEMGVGIDEDRLDEPNGKARDGAITDEDIDFQFPRDAFILVNDPRVNALPDDGLRSGFNGSHYTDFRSLGNDTIPQADNSFYFYFGTEPNKTAIEKMNKMFFKPCIPTKRLEYGEE